MRTRLSLLILLSPIVLTACGTSAADTVPVTVTETTSATTTATTTVTDIPEATTVTETVTDTATTTIQADAPAQTQANTTPMGLAAVPEPAPASTYYKNCSAARAAGAAPVYRGSPGYGTHLDRDGDGIGCE